MGNWPQDRIDQLRVLAAEEELRHRPPGTPEQRHKWNIARRDLFLARQPHHRRGSGWIGRNAPPAHDACSVFSRPPGDDDSA